MRWPAIAMLMMIGAAAAGGREGREGGGGREALPTSRGDEIVVSHPRQDELVVLQEHANFTITLSVGGRLKVPLHGLLVLHLNEDRIAILCPKPAEQLEDCPNGPTEEGDGDVEGNGEKCKEFSVEVGGLKTAEYVLTVELVDVLGNPIRIARRHFNALVLNEIDESLPPHPVFNVIIFSMDRACQLDQLLSSVQERIVNANSSMFRWQVLYKFSNKKFGDGYRKVKKMFPWVSFHQQSNLSSSVTSAYFDMFVAEGGDAKSFKGDYLRLVDDRSPFILHFVDDMVVTGVWSVQEQVFAYRLLSLRPDVLTVSLRLHPGITRCYATGSDRTPPPSFDPEMTWNWMNMMGDWAYPMSLDAHIFRTEDHARLAMALQYMNPNTLEGQMASFCFSGNSACPPRMSCYREAKVINIPANRVQNTFPNRYMSDAPSPALLNTEFLFNRRLITKHLWDKTFDTVHVPQPLIFAVGNLQHEMSEIVREPGDDSE
ncbi:hypothetical protein GUITHDRAFT_106913 [Guillardia theta CCMP2712]|uniref:Hexosyltransferase n=2 Tax=Guillardia theta TaxID=55529 RepID=L1JG29_GUITC|nr:hypothetical protein GUITHDRAFT_106913 [Guillardia theta CCMP2712]EKX47473.1 hypothetical protein GUITHDRAFT_106913 [Guillardia theta CCMP2712]|eukprot:XP_005834453.1 hypothetical protein GUITHDRAFT_106913 [Guillardia theta CCMP2712]